MYKAKALIGEKAGEVIYAKEPDLTHDLCKLWKIYCHECKQFLYFSKSKDPGKRRNYFGHYDYEDKRCPERSFAVNQDNQSKSLTESHEQDLETAELFVEQVFYGINPEYFQNLNHQDDEEQSQQATGAIKWFKASLLYDCKNWIRYYCETTGFLDWKNPEREISYLMDWLHVLVRRDDILKNLASYFISIPLTKKTDIDVILKKFGLLKSKIREESLIWIVALDEIMIALSTKVKSGLSNDLINNDQASIPFLELKLMPKKGKVIFKDKAISRKHHIFFLFRGFSREDGLWVLIPGTNRKYQDAIDFQKGTTNSFSYVVRNSKNESQKCEISLADQIVWNSRPDVSLSKKMSERKNQEVKKLTEEYSLLLYIDEEGDLALKGRLSEQYRRSAVSGISQILFNKAFVSMLFLLEEGFISVDIAEKAAQLALKFQCGDLTPAEALRKFRSLSGIQT